MSTKLVLGILLVVVVGAGGYWYWQDRLTPIITTGIFTENPPAGFVSFTDAEMKVSFNIRTDWQQSSVPESGYPSFISPDYKLQKGLSSENGLGRFLISGAFIGYKVFLPPTGYENKPEEYLGLMKQGYNNTNDPNIWTEISLNGRSAFKRKSIMFPNGFNVVGRVDNRFVDILFAQENQSYSGAFDQFLKSFKVN